LPRSLTASVIPFKESPDTPYILLIPDAISESTIISETLFAKVTDSFSYAYDHPKTLIKISPPCSMIFYSALFSFIMVVKIAAAIKNSQKGRQYGKQVAMKKFQSYLMQWIKKLTQTGSYLYQLAYVF
jgi:hypothetical protein